WCWITLLECAVFYNNVRYNSTNTFLIIRSIAVKYLSSVQAVAFAKMRAAFYRAAISLNAPVYSGQAGESLLSRASSPCFDSCNPLS
ncbi:hypothetical protein, partial [Bacteroides heparinolyticus]|uniref:hypothetical protein n=1 Tax=Prevotella heparinolytica TaxID=28113 RepID=UPI00359F7D1B